MKTPTIDIDSFTMSTGEIVFSLWFWLDGKCVHVGHFDDEFDAKWTGERVLRVAELTRDHIRNSI